MLKVFIAQPLKTSPKTQQELEKRLKPTVDSYLKNKPYTFISPDPTDTLYKLPIDILADYIYYISQSNLVIFPLKWEETKDTLTQNIICNLYKVPNVTEEALTISTFINKNDVPNPK